MTKYYNLQESVVEQINQGNNYLYGIAKALERAPANIHQCINALLAKGIVEVTERKTVNGRQLVYYKLTNQNDE